MKRRMKKKISLIAAMAANRAIGIDGRLPWHLPADLKHFKALTLGHTLVVGRKTHESIGGALPGRRTIVITRQQGYAAPGAEVAHSLEEALEKSGDGEVFIGGGEEIFRRTLGEADRLYLTRIHQDFPGDTFFPEIDESAWTVVEREDHPATEKNPYAFSFLTLDRQP